MDRRIASGSGRQTRHVKSQPKKLLSEMDEEYHRRAEEEMKELYLWQLQRQKENKKFAKRAISLFYKAAFVALALSLLYAIPNQVPAVVKSVRRAALSGAWNGVCMIFVALAFTYGVLGRERAGNAVKDEAYANDNEYYSSGFFQYTIITEEVPVENVEEAVEFNQMETNEKPCPDSKGSEVSEVSESSPKTSGITGVDSRALDAVDEEKKDRSDQDLKSKEGTDEKQEQESSGDSVLSSAEVKESVPESSTEEQNAGEKASDLASFPSTGIDVSDLASFPSTGIDYLPPPPPPPNLSVHYPTLSDFHPLQEDTNAKSHSLKRKRKTIHSATRVDGFAIPDGPSDRHRDRDPHKPDHSHNNGKVKAEKKHHVNAQRLPPRPPPFYAPKESFKRKSGRSKGDSKHRNGSRDETEHKHRTRNEEHSKYRGDKDTVNGGGFLDKKNRKIASAPAPSSLPSTLHHWFSSYGKESKHKTKEAKEKIQSSPQVPPQVPSSKPINNGRSEINFYVKLQSSQAQHSKLMKDPSSPVDDNVSLETPQSRNLYNTETHIDTDNKSTKSSKSSSSSSSSLSSIPLPPSPPPPFPGFEKQRPIFDPRKKMSYAGSVEPDSPEPKHGWANSAVRAQFPIDVPEPVSSPSPSLDDLNRNAEAFIADFHRQLRLQKLNSLKNRR